MVPYRGVALRTVALPLSLVEKLVQQLGSVGVMEVLQRLQSCKSYVLDPHMKALASSLGKKCVRHHSVGSSVESELVSCRRRRKCQLGVARGRPLQMRLYFLAVTGNTLQSFLWTHSCGHGWSLWRSCKNFLCSTSCPSFSEVVPVLLRTLFFDWSEGRSVPLLRTCRSLKTFFLIPSTSQNFPLTSQKQFSASNRIFVVVRWFFFFGVVAIFLLHVGVRSTISCTTWYRAWTLVHNGGETRGRVCSGRAMRVLSFWLASNRTWPRRTARRWSCRRRSIAFVTHVTN